MANILLLTHRIPYPSDKGDKIHTYQLLRHLGRRHHLLLGTFVDNPGDEQHLPQVRAMCAELHAARLHPPLARLRSLAGLVRNRPLTVAYYRDSSMARWVHEVNARCKLDAVIAHSSTMLQYALRLRAPLIADMNDVDSAKWVDYGRLHRWPMSWVYRREAACLLEEERRGAQQARLSLFATLREAALFKSLAPESAARVQVLGNGVDTAYFDALDSRPSPYASGQLPIVFVGTMDYHPNVDAVIWFVEKVLPQVRQRFAQARFYIVGRNPTPAVRALAGAGVSVTGAVPDVRPWLQHAAVVATPMRVVRGIMNKVLEAMAMGRPVVTTQACAESLQAQPGLHLLVADDASGFVAHVERLLSDRQVGCELGQAARGFVSSTYSWAERMAMLDHYLLQVEGVHA